MARLHACMALSLLAREMENNKFMNGVVWVVCAALVLALLIFLIDHLSKSPSTWWRAAGCRQTRGANGRLGCTRAWRAREGVVAVWRRPAQCCSVEHG